LDTQSFERVAASKKPRVRSIAVSAEAIGMEIVNLGSKGMVFTTLFFLECHKNLILATFLRHYTTFFMTILKKIRRKKGG
jgi:hypothetical protein